MAGVVDCWTKGPGVQVHVAENVVSLGDRHGPVIRLSSNRVLTDEQCVALREQILSKTVGGGADLHVNRYRDERKFARVGLAQLKEVWGEDVWRMIATDLVEPYFRGCLFFLAWLFFDFSRGVGRSQNNGLRPLSCFTGFCRKLLATRGAPAEP